MRHYAFALGRYPYLSLAELDAVLPRYAPSYQFTDITEEIAVVATESDIPTDALMRRLGGTIKIATVLETIGLDADKTAFLNVFSPHRLINDIFPKHKGKLHVGVSLYDAGADKVIIDHWRPVVEMVSNLIKDNLRTEDVRCGFVQIKDRILSSVSVEKNNLLNKGVEIQLIATPTKLLIAKTDAVQEFAAFSLRDYQRPAKDKRSGMLPPKIARMMINMTKKAPAATLLDPFCGSGTILQEALMLGYKQIIGTDSSEKAIRDSRKNIEWLTRFVIDSRKYQSALRIFVQDVTTIGSRLERGSVHAIVTEPFLGPPLYRHPDPRRAQEILASIQPLLEEALRQFRTVLHPDGTIVMIFPAFVCGNTTYRMELDRVLQTLGFSRQPFFTDTLQQHPFLHHVSPTSLLYGNKDQFVTREIVCLRFKS